MPKLIDIAVWLVDQVPDNEPQSVNAAIDPILFRISGHSTLEKGAVLAMLQKRTGIDITFLREALDEVTDPFPSDDVTVLLQLALTNNVQHMQTDLTTATRFHENRQRLEVLGFKSNVQGATISIQNTLLP